MLTPFLGNVVTHSIWWVRRTQFLPAAALVSDGTSEVNSAGRMGRGNVWGGLGRGLGSPLLKEGNAEAEMMKVFYW